MSTMGVDEDISRISTGILNQIHALFDDNSNLTRAKIGDHNQGAVEVGDGALLGGGLAQKSKSLPFGAKVSSIEMLCFQLC